MKWVRHGLPVASLAALSLAGCAARAPDARALYRASTRLGEAVDKGDRETVWSLIVPAERQRVATDALLAAPQSEAWGEALQAPTSVRPEGWMAIAPDRWVEIIWTDGGWRFSTDPFEAYPQGTPREALSSLVQASRRGRWEVLVDLAPRRYRIGLGQEEIEAAWTEGEYAQELRTARDRLAEHLDAPISSDAHQAILDLGNGHFARLEREGERWVVVDF